MAEYLRNRGYIKGIDISNWQKNVNYQKLKNAGVEVAILKASEGTSYRDTVMETHYNGCKAVGIKIGFYHFFRGNVDAKQQAQHFINCIGNKSYDVKLVLDIESTEGKGKTDLTNMAIDFLEEVKRLTGKEVMVYTYTSFANSNLDNRLSSYPVWIAQYSPQDPDTNSVWGNKWDGFQFASDGSIDGYNGNLDLNEFKSSIFQGGAATSTPVQQAAQPTVDTPDNPKWRNVYDGQIAELQRILNAKGHNLAVDGYIGPKTYAAVKGYTINLGDRGPLTKWVQDRLNTMQYNAGYADGYAEQPTMDGISRFQKAYGLGVGYLGGTDWYYLTNR